MSKSKVFVLGSINTDLMISADRLPHQGETMNGHGFVQTLGGKGGNQAVAVSRLGTSTHLIGNVGNDSFGNHAISEMNRYGVHVAGIHVNDEVPTGTAVIIRVDNDSRIILDAGANEVVTSSQIDKYVKGGTDDYFLAQFEVPLEHVAYGLEISKKQGMTTIVNPAPAVAVADAIYQNIDYLVLNQTETEILAGIFPNNVRDVEQAAAIFFEKGVHAVVVTMGSEGSVYCDQQKTVEAAPFKVEVVDTTGAGDAFIGTMLYGLTQNIEIERTLKLASAAGALACTKVGAQASMPRLSNLEAFMKAQEEE